MNKKIGSIAVVNVKYQPQNSYYYIGRSFGNRKGSSLGNPFKIGQHGDRAEVIKLYRNYATKQLTDPSSPFAKEYQHILEKVKNGENVKLGCFCAPLPCHGDVIKEMIQQQITSEIQVD